MDEVQTGGMTPIAGRWLAGLVTAAMLLGCVSQTGFRNDALSQIAAPESASRTGERSDRPMPPQGGKKPATAAPGSNAPRRVTIRQRASVKDPDVRRSAVLELSDPSGIRSSPY